MTAANQPTMIRHGAGQREPPDTAQLTRITLRPIATPFPLGFLALVCASLLVSGLELGWFSSSDSRTVGLALIVFVFPLQLLAAVFGFLGRDTVAATGFAVQGGAWLMIGLEHVLHGPGHTSPALGVFLIGASAGILICTAGSSLGKLAPAIVLGLVGIRLLITGLHEITAATAAEHIAGIVGLIIVPLAAYVALALEVEDLKRNTVLPLLRRSSGAEAMTASLADQTRGIEHEAGVREQL